MLRCVFENIQWFVETWSGTVDSCCVAVSCFNWRLSVCLCSTCLRTGDVTGAKSLRTQNVWIWNGSQHDFCQPCRPSFSNRNQVFNFQLTHDVYVWTKRNPPRRRIRKQLYFCDLQQFPATALDYYCRILWEALILKIMTTNELLRSDLCLSVSHPDEHSQDKSSLDFVKLQLSIVEPRREENASGHQTKEIAFFLFNAGMWLSSISAPVTIHRSLSHQTCSLQGSNCHFATRWSVPPNWLYFHNHSGKKKKRGQFPFMSCYTCAHARLQSSPLCTRPAESIRTFRLPQVRTQK